MIIRQNPHAPLPSRTLVAADGKRVILWLFLALSLATLVSLLYFATQAPPAARPRVYMALVGNLVMAGLVLLLFVFIGRKRAHVTELPDAE